MAKITEFTTKDRRRPETNEGPIAPRFARVVSRGYQDPKHLLHFVVLGIPIFSRHGSPAPGRRRDRPLTAVGCQAFFVRLRSASVLRGEPVVSVVSVASQVFAACRTP